MKKIVLLLVIAAFMVAGIFSPAVSAAGTADGKEILDGELSEEFFVGVSACEQINRIYSFTVEDLEA